MRYIIVNLILALLPPTRFFAFKAKLLRCLGVDIHPSSKVCGDVRFYGAGRVTIGEGCWIGLGCTFYTSKTGHIVIGDCCDIAPQVAFMCGSHEIGGPERRAGEGIADSIVVGEGCWIGIRTTLLGGARVGASSIVGAGSLLLPADYPNDFLVAGIPAKPKKGL